MAKGYNYKINEGNMIAHTPARFETDALKAAIQFEQDCIVAGEEITKGQLVYLSDAFEVSVVQDNSKAILGVALHSAAAGDKITIETEGLFNLKCTGSVTAGSRVTGGAGGTVATAAADEPNVCGLVIGDAVVIEDDGTVSNSAIVKFSI